MSPSQTPSSPTDPAQLRRALWVARLYYFGFFAALGALVPYFNVYLQQRGLSGAEIGLLSAIPPLVALAANPFWGAVADRWQAHQRVLAGLALTAGLASLAYIWVDRFWSILLVFCVTVFFRTPIGAIVDATVMGLVARNPEVSYGRQRVFGSFGWIAFSYGVGLLVTGYSMNAIFLFHALMLAGMCALLSLALPVERASGTVHYQEGLRTLVRLPSYRALLVLMTCFGAASACHSNFVGLNILRLGGAATLIGVTNALSATLEIPALFLSHLWFARVSNRTTLALTAVGFALIFALMAFARAPWQVTVATAAVGACFALFWTAAVGFTHNRAPAGLAASAQAIAQAGHGGLGWALGSAASGLLWDWGRGAAVYAFAAVVIGVGALVFAQGTRRDTATR